MYKNILRKKHLYLRQQIPLKTVLSLSDQITKKVFQHEWYQNADTIFTYVSIKNEVDTLHFIIQALDEKKQIAVPKTFKNGIMKFYFIQSLDDLSVGKFGLQEPSTTLAEAIPDENALILVPGVVFDYVGNRIGYGAGYYDNYLKQFPNSKTIALAFESQVIDSIISDAHDVLIKRVLTELNEYPK